MHLLLLAERWITHGKVAQQVKHSGVNHYSKWSWASSGSVPCVAKELIGCLVHDWQVEQYKESCRLETDENLFAEVGHWVFLTLRFIFFLVRWGKKAFKKKHKCTLLTFNYYIYISVFISAN